jgi:hypothetical protein
LDKKNLIVIAVALTMAATAVSQFPSSEAWIEADRATIRLDPEKFTELPRMLQVTHTGINDAFVEKASVVWYWHTGKWLQLTASN